MKKRNWWQRIISQLRNWRKKPRKDMSGMKHFMEKYAVDKHKPLDATFIELRDHEFKALSERYVRTPPGPERTALLAKLSDIKDEMFSPITKERLEMSLHDLRKARERFVDEPIPSGYDYYDRPDYPRRKDDSVTEEFRYMRDRATENAEEIMPQLYDLLQERIKLSNSYLAMENELHRKRIRNTMGEVNHKISLILNH